MLDISLTPFLLLIVSGLALIVAELLVGIDAGFDLVLLGSILIIGGILGQLTNDLSLAIILCAILSFLYIFFGRSVIKSKLVVSTYQTNIDNMIGKLGVVTSTISPQNAGMIKIDGEKWRARADQKINSGQQAKVLSIEGVTLSVEKAQQKE